MSLINDMLKDLDRRDQLSFDSPVASLHGPGTLGIKKRDPAAIRITLWSLATVVITAGLLGLVQYQPSLMRFTYLAATGNQPVDSTNANPAEIDQNTLLAIPAKTASKPQHGMAKHETADLQSGKNLTTEKKQPSHKTHQQLQQQQSSVVPEKTVSSPPEVTAWQKLATKNHRPPSAVSPQSSTTAPALSAQQQSQAIQKAASAIAAGNYSDAKRLLEGLLLRNKAQHKVRLLLANLYMSQDQNTQAESLLVNGLALDPRNTSFAKLYAQLLADQGRDNEAIDVLQTTLPAAANDADYYALLAGLYQRNEQAAAAMEGYRAALRISPENGQWWLGLGISSEQAGNRDIARRAFEEALRYPLATSLQQYVEKRLQILRAASSVADKHNNTNG